MARGNRLFADGYYHEAAALYLEAGAGSDPIASYDLANVFSALGEREAASSMRARAVALGEAAGDAGLKARARFNDGVDAYAAGAFDEAAAAFRTALTEAARITSYNVCYTKLLRGVRHARSASAGRYVCDIIRVDDPRQA